MQHAEATIIELEGQRGESSLSESLLNLHCRDLNSSLLKGACNSLLARLEKQGSVSLLLHALLWLPL